MFCPTDGRADLRMDGEETRRISSQGLLCHPWGGLRSRAVAGLRPSHTSRPKVSLHQSDDGHAKLNRFAVQETCGRTWVGVRDPGPAPSFIAQPKAPAPSAGR